MQLFLWSDHLTKFFKTKRLCTDYTLFSIVFKIPCPQDGEIQATPQRRRRFTFPPIQAERPWPTTEHTKSLCFNLIAHERDVLTKISQKEENGRKFIHIRLSSKQYRHQLNILTVYVVGVLHIYCFPFMISFSFFSLSLFYIFPPLCSNNPPSPII